MHSIAVAVSGLLYKCGCIYLMVGLINLNWQGIRKVPQEPWSCLKTRKSGRVQVHKEFVGYRWFSGGLYDCLEQKWSLVMNLVFFDDSAKIVVTRGCSSLSPYRMLLRFTRMSRTFNHFPKPPRHLVLFCRIIKCHGSLPILVAYYTYPPSPVLATAPYLQYPSRWHLSVHIFRVIELLTRSKVASKWKKLRPQPSRAIFSNEVSVVDTLRDVVYS